MITLTLAELITILVVFIGSIGGGLIGVLIVFYLIDNDTSPTTILKGNYKPIHRTEAQEAEIEDRNRPDSF